MTIAKDYQGHIHDLFVEEVAQFLLTGKGGGHKTYDNTGEVGWLGGARPVCLTPKSAPVKRLSYI